VRKLQWKYKNFSCLGNITTIATLLFSRYNQIEEFHGLFVLLAKEKNFCVEERRIEKNREG